MTECGIEVVVPHQADHAAAEPDAFRIAGRTIDGLLGLDEFLDLALVGFPRGSGVGLSGLLFGLVRRIRCAALGESAAVSGQERKACDKARYGKVAQSSVLQLKQPSTHVFPDNVPAPAGSS